MSIKKYAVAIGVAIGFATSAISLAQEANVVESSTGVKVEAKAIPGQTLRKANDEGTWSTQGSGSCDTGNLTCTSGRQIGCNATGDYVYCSDSYGDVGTVYCYASSSDGTTSSFSDACP